MIMVWVVMSTVMTMVQFCVQRCIMMQQGLPVSLCGVQRGHVFRAVAVSMSINAIDDVACPSVIWVKQLEIVHHVYIAGYR